MSLRVIDGPAPIAVPADIPGDHDPADTRVAALIAGVQAVIDGPTGWLRRSLGEQTIALSVPSWQRAIGLPCGPVVVIDSVAYRDRLGEEQTVDQSVYRCSDNRCLFGTGFSFPAVECADDAITVTYKAGYDAQKVPANAKQAVIIGVLHLKSLGDQSLFLREEDVEGVGSTVYTVSEAATAVVKAATDMLLQPLKVRSL